MATFTVPAGSNLTKAAQSLGISLARLLELNPEYKSNPNRVAAGAVIQGEPEATPAPAAPAANDNPAGLIELPSFPSATQVLEGQAAQREADAEAARLAQEQQIAAQETARIERERVAAEEEAALRRRNSFDTVKGILAKYGLSGLEDWAWTQIEDDVSVAGVELSLQDQQDFKDRFPAMALRSDQNLNAITPFEYLAWEDGARELFKRYALPSGFYDSDDDWTAFIAGDVSVAELNDRIGQAYTRVATSSDEVRQVYAEWFGPSGDSALAAYHLDPERAAPLLIEQADQALVGGVGRALDINISQTTAETLENLGVGQQAAYAGFRQLNDLRSLFDETISEATDLNIGTEGVDAQFGLSSQAARVLERRRASRVNMARGGGGATISQQGVIGLGTAS